jgi:hypothetical protein
MESKEALEFIKNNQKRRGTELEIKFDEGEEFLKEILGTPQSKTKSISKGSGIKSKRKTRFMVNINKFNIINIIVLQ